MNLNFSLNWHDISFTTFQFTTAIFCVSTVCVCLCVVLVIKSKTLNSKRRCSNFDLWPQTLVQIFY